MLILCEGLIPYVGIINFPRNMQLEVSSGIKGVDSVCNIRSPDSISHRTIFFDHNEKLALIGKYTLETAISRSWEPLSMVNMTVPGRVLEYCFLYVACSLFYNFPRFFR